MAVPYKFKFRRGSPIEWQALNVILEPGEPGIEIGTNRFKIGDGVTRWRDLPYFLSTSEVLLFIESSVNNTIQNSQIISTLLSDHVNDQTPHPVYDDSPSLELLYQNAKV